MWRQTITKNKKTKVESKKWKVSAVIKDKKVEDISVDIKEKIIYSKNNKFILKHLIIIPLLSKII